MQHKLKVFLSYSEEDGSSKEKLVKHLTSLKKEGLIDTWDAAQLVASSEWDTERQSKLAHADIILLLLSSDAIANDYVYDKEIQNAIARAKNRQSIVMPILLRPCDIQSLDVEAYGVLPTDNKAISTWKNEDSAYVHIAECLRVATKNYDDILKNPDPKKFFPIPQKEFSKIHIISLALVLPFLLLSLYLVQNIRFNKQEEGVFNISFAIKDTLGQLITETSKAQLIFSIGKSTKTQPLFEGQAAVNDIPIKFKKDTINVQLKGLDGYELLSPQNKYALNTDEQIIVQVKKDNSLSKLFGNVKKESGDPIENAEVWIPATPLTTHSDLNGYFELQIPPQHQSEQIRLSVKHPLYKPNKGNANVWEETVYPKTNTAIVVVLKPKNPYQQ